MPVTKVRTPSGEIINVNHPEGASQADIIAYAKQHYQDNQGFDVKKMIENIPSSALHTAESMVQPLVHPAETIQGLAQVASGAAQHLAAGDNPSAVYAQPENVKAADQTWQGLKDRYGGIDQLKKTAQNDPVGLASDTIGLLMGGAGLFGKAGELARLSPTRAMLNTPEVLAKGAAKIVPDSALRGMYERSAKFSTTIPKDVREGMAQTALDKGIMPTYAGVDKLNGLVEDLGNKVGGIIDKATAEGKQIPKTQILTEAVKARRNLDKVSTADYLNMRRRYNDVIASQAEAWKGVKFLTPRQAQDFKRSLDTLINHDRAMKQMGGAYQPGAESARMDLRTATKNSIENVAPEVGPANQELGQLKQLQSALPRSANRLENNNIVDIQAPIMAGAGYAVGGDLGGMAGTMLGAAQMPKPRAWIALTIKELKKSPMKDLYFSKSGLTEAGRQVLIQLGRMFNDQQASSGQVQQ